MQLSGDITDFQLKERKKESTKMGEKKPEPLDFVKDFQEYLTQQTHHVNMISGSVSGDKEAETLQLEQMAIKTDLITHLLKFPWMKTQEC